MAAFIGWAERAAAKKSRKPAAVVRKKAAPQAQRAPIPFSTPAAEASKPSPAVATPFIDSSNEGESGIRDEVSTVAAGHKPKAAEPAGHRQFDRDALRNAVLWGEILQRKF